MACLSKSGFSTALPRCCLNMSWRVASGSEVNPAVQLCVKSRVPKPAHRWHLLLHCPPPPKPPPFQTPRGQKIGETCHERQLQEQATLSRSVAAALMHADTSHDDALRRNVKEIIHLLWLYRSRHAIHHMHVCNRWGRFSPDSSSVMPLER